MIYNIYILNYFKPFYVKVAGRDIHVKAEVMTDGRIAGFPIQLWVSLEDDEGQVIQDIGLSDQSWSAALRVLDPAYYR